MGGILSAWSFPWGGGGYVRVDYVRGGFVLHLWFTTAIYTVRTNCAYRTMSKYSTALTDIFICESKSPVASDDRTESTRKNSV